MIRALSFFTAVLCAFCLATCSPKASDATADPNAELRESQQDLAVVAFYNLENLFDIDDDPTNWGDDEWLPTSEKAWTAKRYLEKQQRLSQVILDLGGTTSPGGPALLGVCEVENERVLQDLSRQALLKRSGYSVIHFDSPDGRGIDNALLYRKDLFTPTHSQPICVRLGTRDDGSPRTTRDIVYVAGLLQGDEVHILVNHWPSRRGGEAKSRPRRVLAAQKARKVVDSILVDKPEADIILMGDFNDDPVSPSIKDVLKAGAKKSEARLSGLYNPMMSLYRQGDGSLGYRDSWNLFDQLIVSAGLAEASTNWQLRNVRVFRENYLLNPAGRFKGYPLRTYVGNTYQGGYSDHLPAIGVLKRPARG